jgi:uncharacterized protein
MKILIIGVTVILSVLVPVAHADEGPQRVIAEDLLQTMKVDQMMNPVFAQMRSMMEQQFSQMGAPEELKPMLKRYIDKLFNVIEQTSSWKTLKEDMINIYIHAFTEDELKGMLAFYKSPVGQSVIDKMPVAMQRSMLIVQKRMPELQEKIKKISEEFTAEIKTEMEKKKMK